MIEFRETFDEHQQHARTSYLEGDPPRASLAPFLAWLLIALVRGVLITLALSAAMSTATRARFRTPSSMAVSGIAAVRAIVMDPRTSEDPVSASDAGRRLLLTVPSQSFTTAARDDRARILAT